MLLTECQICKNAFSLLKVLFAIDHVVNGGEVAGQ